MPTLTELADQLYGADHTKKPGVYLEEYERLLETRRNDNVRVLELGVHRGVSMKMWEVYLPNAIVVGLDGNLPEMFPQSSRFHFLHGAQDDINLLNRGLELAGGQFDIIIDDASHLGCHTARSFAHLFPHALRPGGYYLIEDICTAFTSSGGTYDAAHYTPPEIGLPGMPRIFPSHEWGMIGLVKQLLDHTMGPTACGGYTRYAIERMIVKTNMAMFQKAGS